MSSKVGLPTPIEPPHWGQENCEYSGVVLMTTGVIPTVWLDFQPAVGLQHSFPSSSPNPSPSLTVLSLSWSGIHSLDALTGSSAFFKFQLHTNPVSTFFLINNWLHKSIITRTHESKEHVEGEKILWVESLYGKAVYCHFQATRRQCTEPDLKHRLTVFAAHKSKFHRLHHFCWLGDTSPGYSPARIGHWVSFPCFPWSVSVRMSKTMALAVGKIKKEADFVSQEEAVYFIRVGCS